VISPTKRTREEEVVQVSWPSQFQFKDAEGFELLIGLSLAAQLHAADNLPDSMAYKRKRIEEDEPSASSSAATPEMPSFTDDFDSKDDQEQAPSEGYSSTEESQQEPLMMLQESAKIEDSDQKDLEDWYQSYFKLREFKEANETIEVTSRDDRSLFAWIKYQRKETTKNNLTQDQIKLLEEIGFQWNTRISSKHSWEDKFQKLKEFQESHGHCKVPLKLDRQLNSWVDAQRQANKQGRLSQERIDKLESLGVQWIVKSWESKYKKLKEFQQIHGHCNVPLHSEKQLYRWVVDQRRAKKRGKLSAERVKKLEDLGIRLTSKKDAAKLKERSSPRSSR